MEIDYDIFISFKNNDTEGKPTKDREFSWHDVSLDEFVMVVELLEGYGDAK